MADEYLGDEMAANIERYREVLAETPVELEVRDRPSVHAFISGWSCVSGISSTPRRVSGSKTNCTGARSNGSTNTPTASPFPSVTTGDR